ncbi:MAG: hypothetical protein HY262_12785 [Chloroflexi bacterium]|nr:hypothetical protein [Chloroflexota bacterium]
MGDPKESTVAEALQAWRSAERVAAVARRGRLAAEEAATAAKEAAEAANATAEAARSALASMTLAEASASKTATAAKLAAQAMNVELVDSLEEAAMADVDEAVAQTEYRRATDRASARSRPKT